MKIKKYLILVLVMMSAGLTSASVHATKHGVKRTTSESTSSAQETVKSENDESPKKRVKESKQSEVSEPCAKKKDEDEKKEYTTQEPESDHVVTQSKSDTTDKSMEEKPSTKSSEVGLTSNARAIVKSVSSVFGIVDSGLEHPTAADLGRRLDLVHRKVCQEKALCTVPVGNTMIIGNVNNNREQSVRNIVIARLALEQRKSNSVVFLGDFLHSGGGTVETLNELLKFKLDFPDKVFLVNGNIESIVLKELMEGKSDFLQDISLRFSKEESADLFRRIFRVFKCLPVMVEVPLSTDKRVLCVPGYLNSERWSRAYSVGSDSYLRQLPLYFEYAKHGIRLMRKYNTEQMIRGNGFVRADLIEFYNGLGLNRHEQFLGNFLKQNGFISLVKCENIRSQYGIFGSYGGRCIVLSSAIGLITKEKVHPFCEISTRSEGALNSSLMKCVHDFVQNSDRSDPDVILSLGILEDACGNHELARQYYKQAIDKGYAFAKFYLGYDLEFGRGIEKNERQALEKYREVETRGDVLSRIGSFYFDGKGNLEVNYEKAVEYFIMAEKYEEVYVYYQLGFCYEKGLGVKQDCAKAVEYYNRAVRYGKPYAQYRLGLCFENGIGVTKNDSKAAIYYFMAAKKGHAGAQYKLGECYEYAKGVIRNYKLAAFWYDKAANQGAIDAQFRLGLFYEVGKGGRQDYKLAMFWYNKAAEGENVDAQFRLALFYEEGKGGNLDYTQALYWYKKVVKNKKAGDKKKEAKDKVDDLEATMALLDLNSLTW